ncbi:putative late blight resistance protein homolog R1A-10 isoform X2 [Andrographis paniculata]|uniref:putative late blight resistance protein homolog R1A-10 isoform X2 n=1 Tax=Andrographis paniculata TaxID=175694 RepID=UPI0021E7F61D|nr:putative late blight resistance protein homolog R1A-10 isoform X2 [Andrographis paniculata]
MAVAAYASLVSLTNILENLHYRAQFNLPRADMKQVEKLQENVQFLLKFVELHSERVIPDELQGLWRQMAKAAFEAEDTINFHVVNLLHLRHQEETTDAAFSDFCEDMEGLIQNLCTTKKSLPMMEEIRQDDRVQEQSSASASVSIVGSSDASEHASNVVVGIDKHVSRIRDKLIRGKSNIQIIPVVGMGGIGKTTLAKCAFDDSFVVDHFDLRIWFSISQEYSVEQILRIGLQEKVEYGHKRESLDELGNKFYQKLFGRRYLIVMDDMWGSGAWDELRKFFPDNENGSRIMFTTRLKDLATSLGSCDPYPLTFLDEHTSWELFCQNAFSQIGCPYDDLENLAKDIAKSCRGLPLAIVVIGRLLAKSDKNAKYWENITKNISSLASMGDDEHCFKILSLSYRSLPIHLKPCFLYMRFFPEDDRIDVNNLIKLWIAEGFIKPTSQKSLEDIASEYVKGLLDRNLIFIRSIEKCGVHDLLRDLCLTESASENFIRSPKVQRIRSHYHTDACCFICSEEINGAVAEKLLKTFHVFSQWSEFNPLYCDACKPAYSHIARPRLVRLMGDLINGVYHREILLPTEVHYATICYFFGKKLISPRSQHLLWNLQTLIIGVITGRTILPPEIWEMPQLRHLICKPSGYLPDPTATATASHNIPILKNLQILSAGFAFKCTDNILARIPNVKDLEIDYFEGESFDLRQLQELESLCVWSLHKIRAIPNSLKRLSLDVTRPEDMPIIGSLPRLESLKIGYSYHVTNWNPVEGEFLHLKELYISHAYGLVCWSADQSHFPILERLKMKTFPLLEEIPWGIGDIPTLESIMLEECNDSLIHSAKEMWEEQQSMGNDSLRVYVMDGKGKGYQMVDDNSKPQEFDETEVTVPFFKKKDRVQALDEL